MKSPFKNDIFALIYKAFENLHTTDKEINCYWQPELKDEQGNEVYGLTNFEDDGNITVLVSGVLPVLDCAEILAHELAHIMVGFEQEHNEKWEKAFDDIQTEYMRITESGEITENE